MAKYKITEEQKKEITEKANRNPHMFYINSDLSNPLYWKIIADNQRIDEGLICTYSPEKTYEYVNDLFDFDDEQIKMISSKTSAAGDTSKKFIVTIEKNDRLEDAVEHAFNLCGYLKSKRLAVMDKFELMFIPKYTGEATEIVKNIGSLVHITPVYNKKKILSSGFLPKHKNGMFTHDGRVYFFPNDKRLYREIHYQMEDFDTCLRNKRNDSVWSLFVVDVNKIGNAKFYFDPNYGNGIYTYDNIPPSAITANTDVDLKKLPFNLE
jgi:hypothetical protein